MTTTRLSRFALEAALIPLLALAVFGISATNRALEAHSAARTADGDVGPLPDGPTLRVLSLGFERLVADLFWVRTTYYVGSESAQDAQWPAAERLADLVTDLDPSFDTAYVVMSSVLSGLRSDPDAAIRLLEKAAPITSYWRIHFMLGFQYFMEKGDYEKGAKCLERAVELGGPHYLQFLVSRLYAQAGDPTTAMQFLSARLQNEENKDVRQKLEKRIWDIWINRDLGGIDQANAKFRKAKKRDARSVQELVDAGLLPALPRDPRGGSYSLVAGRGKTDLPYETLELKKMRGMQK